MLTNPVTGLLIPGGEEGSVAAQATSKSAEGVASGVNEGLQTVKDVTADLSGTVKKAINREGLTADEVASRNAGKAAKVSSGTEATKAVPGTPGTPAKPGVTGQWEGTPATPGTPAIPAMPASGQKALRDFLLQDTGKTWTSQAKQLAGFDPTTNYIGSYARMTKNAGEFTTTFGKDAPAAKEFITSQARAQAIKLLAQGATLYGVSKVIGVNLPTLHSLLE